MEKGGRGGEKEKEKNKKRGLPLDKVRGPPLMFLNFFFPHNFTQPSNSRTRLYLGSTPKGIT
jgi:hypothetical protein